MIRLGQSDRDEQFGAIVLGPQVRVLSSGCSVLGTFSGKPLNFIRI